MSSKRTKSILKKKPLSHKKTVAFRPNLESVKFISQKSKEGEPNWRRELSQTSEEHKLARTEREEERAEKEAEKEAELLPILQAIRTAKTGEIRSLRGMQLTKKRRDMLGKLFRPHTKEQEQEIASTLISVSKQQRIPLTTVLESVQVAATSPRRSISSRMFNGLKSMFSSSKRGGRKRTMKRKT